MNIGMLLFPGLTQLDLTGPFEVFHRIPGAAVHLVWKTTDPVRADSGLSIVPTITLADCPPLDVVMVPGGFGQIALMDDAETLDFLRELDARSRADDEAIIQGGQGFGLGRPGASIAPPSESGVPLPVRRDKAA
jgi:transcriptional regulator GlxA family with amidase domain